jgi:HEAT repeat protein
MVYSLSVLLFVFFALQPTASKAAVINQITDDSGKILIAGLNEGSIPELVKLLEHSGSSEASQAREALLEFGPKAVPELMKALEQEKYPEAIFPLLAQIGDTRAIVPIFRKINSPSWETANNARGALRAYGNAAVPDLFEGLNAAPYFEASLDVLKDIPPDKDSLALVRRFARDGSSKQRAAAAYLLGTWRDDSSVPDIEKALKDGDVEVRTKALDGYETLFLDTPAQYNRQILVGMMSDTSPYIRQKAILILQDNFPKAAYPTLVKMAKEEKDEEVRYIALEALGIIGDIEFIVPLLETIQKEKNQHILSGAVFSVGKMKAEEGKPYLLGLFDRMNVGLELQGSIIGALLKIGKPVDVDIFLEYLAIANPHDMPPLLSLMNINANPGDERLIKGLEEFRPKALTPEMTEMVDVILSRIKK